MSPRYVRPRTVTGCHFWPWPSEHCWRHWRTTSTESMPRSRRSGAAHPHPSATSGVGCTSWPPMPWSSARKSARQRRCSCAEPLTVWSSCRSPIERSALNCWSTTRSSMATSSPPTRGLPKPNRCVVIRSPARRVRGCGHDSRWPRATSSRLWTRRAGRPRRRVASGVRSKQPRALSCWPARGSLRVTRPAPAGCYGARCSTVTPPAIVPCGARPGGSCVPSAGDCRRRIPEVGRCCRRVNARSPTCCCTGRTIDGSPSSCPCRPRRCASTSPEFCAPSVCPAGSDWSPRWVRAGCRSGRRRGRSPRASVPSRRWSPTGSTIVTSPLSSASASSLSRSTSVTRCAGGTRSTASTSRGSGWRRSQRSSNPGRDSATI